eukprot:1832251-Prymnesium_polylepis.1
MARERGPVAAAREREPVGASRWLIKRECAWPVAHEVCKDIRQLCESTANKRVAVRMARRESWRG